MSAYRKVYVKQWEHQAPDERYSVHVERGGKPVAGIKPERIASVDEEVIDWRKANHIHGWFVDNVQRGDDDCREYRVGWDELRSLLNVCTKVLEASKLVEGTVYDGTVYDKEHPAGLARRVPGKVIEDVTMAVALLPTKEGFFFGSTEYDEDYLAEVQRTRNWAADMLADMKAGVPGDIYYRSSW